MWFWFLKRWGPGVFCYQPNGIKGTDSSDRTVTTLNGTPARGKWFPVLRYISCYGQIVSGCKQTSNWSVVDRRMLIQQAWLCTYCPAESLIRLVTPIFVNTVMWTHLEYKMDVSLSFLSYPTEKSLFDSDLSTKSSDQPRQFMCDATSYRIVGPEMGI